jgi:enoyl-CoA hydratase
VVGVSERDVRVRMDGPVAVAELASGRANALDTALCRRIAEVFGELADGPARAVVLTGAGAMFSAGVDLIKVTEGGPAYIDEFLPALTAAFMAVFGSGLPVVAAVNGHAIAGGCILACACDHRVMNADAGRVGVTELLVGVPFPVAAMEILRFAVGTPRLSGLIMSGQTYEAADAVRLGLADEAAGAAEVLPRAVEAAGRFAALHPPAAAQARRQIRAQALERIAAQRAEDDAVHAIWRSPQALAAIGAYVSRVLRRPA